MHRAIGYLSKRFVHVKEGEAPKVLLTFLYFFLVITAYYVIKPVSRSLVLGDLGSRFVPYVDLISAIVMGPMVTLFARLAGRIEKHRLVSLTFFAVAGCLVGFWRLLQLSDKWVVAAFYIWVSIFSVLVVTLFWLVANDLYHAREAKRLFGFIGSGGILGGIVGSSIAAAGAKLIGTKQLLLLSATLLLVCWAVVQRLWRYAPPIASDRPDHAQPRTPYFSKLHTSLRSLSGSRYLLLLVGLVAISKIVSTLIYYQFNPFIEQMFPNQDAKTAFTGLFFGWMNIAAFLIQFVFTSWILRRMGLAFALLFLPVGLLAGSMGLILVPMFWLAASAELYDGSMNYSLQQTAKEMLYLPMDRSIRYQIKPFIDMVVFRFGKGIAAIAGIVCLDWLGLNSRVLAYVCVPLIIGWLVLAVQLRHDYITTIRNLLQARASRRRRDDRPSPEDRLRETFLPPGSSGEQKLVLVGELLRERGVEPKQGEQLLEMLRRYQQQPTSIEPSGFLPPLEDLKEIIHDRHEPMVARRYAIKQLVLQNGQDAVDALLGMLIVEEDSLMREELVRGLLTLRLTDPSLEFPKPMIRRQLAKEVEHYQRLAQVATIYRLQDSRTAQAQPDDPILSLLRVLMEECSQQIFQLLSLVYRPEDIGLIYHQMREPDTYIRADAIELLDNLIDPGFRWIIFPVLDEDRFLGVLDGNADVPELEPGGAVRVLQQGLWDHHRWLSLTIVWVVSRLQCEALYPDLDQAARSSTPVLSLAAQVVRQRAS